MFALDIQRTAAGLNCPINSSWWPFFCTRQGVARGEGQRAMPQIVNWVDFYGKNWLK